MARRVEDAVLSTRSARMRLTARAKPYWRLIAEGLHLGYRRSTVARRAGTWLCRRYLGDERYEVHALGAADDFPDMHGATNVLRFDEAISAARGWAHERADAERTARAGKVVPTVRQAIEGYIARRRRKASPGSGQDAELRLSHHVLRSPLAELSLDRLTREALDAWREGLRRGGRAASDEPLASSTLARLLNDVRAALRAGAQGADLAKVGALVRDALRAPADPDRARAKQILPDAEVRRIIEAAYTQDDDFGALVLVLAATGCRLSQAARLTVADLQVDRERIMIPVSLKGRGQKHRDGIAVPLPADTLARLRPLIAGRRAHELLLMRWHHRQVEGDKEAGRLPAWTKDERRAWRFAAEMVRPWRATLTTAQLPADLVPYCLRHSSIVRGLRAGLPVRLVAAAHDTSVAMIERHYGHFIVDASEDLLRRAAMLLTPAGDTAEGGARKPRGRKA
jgi:integrase